jgi:hypothetical protein
MRVRTIVTLLLVWKTNGLGVGTSLVQDIADGVPSSTPQLFVQAANQVFFVASDSAHGTELWVVPIDALDVSLEDQIGELLALLTDPALDGLALPAALTAQLSDARREVGRENIAGQFVAARAHLTNFVNHLDALMAHGAITAAQGQPLLDGARSILEQIEGSQPGKAHAELNDLEM